MRAFRSILILTYCTVFITMAAHAQIYGTGKENEAFPSSSQSFQSVPYYNQMVRDALKNRPKKFDFMKLRVFYSQTPQYDPYSEDALDSMNKYAFIAMNDEDPERAKSALLAYQAVVSNHLANVEVVTQALSLAKQDKRFGNPEFFKWMKEGLIHTVVISGSGYSLQQAYDIITFQEEIILFGRLRVRPLETLSRKEGIIFYNMHEVQEVDTGKTYTLFVNTSIPMRVMERRDAFVVQSKPLDLRKQ